MDKPHIEQRRKAKYARQTNEIYREIGRFTVKFEHISFAMQMGIQQILGRSGLANQQLAHIILAEQTAYPLKSMLQAMIAETGNLDKTDLIIADKIFKQLGVLIEKRNNIIHSTWFVGWASEEDTNFSEVDSRKLSRGKTGAGIKKFDYTASDFTLLSDECEVITKMINRLWAIVSFGSKVSDNFVIGPDSKVALPPDA